MSIQDRGLKRITVVAGVILLLGVSAFAAVSFLTRSVSANEATGANDAPEVRTDAAFTDVLDEDPSSKPLASAIAAAGGGIKAPSTDVLGKAVRSMDFKNEKGKPGLAIEFSSGVHFIAEHGHRPGELEAMLGAYSINYDTGERRYVFAEKSNIETMSIEGRFAMVRHPATQTNPDGSTLRYVGEHLTVQDGDTYYIFRGRESGRTEADLVEAATSLFK